MICKRTGADDGQKVICWGADFAKQSTIPAKLANGNGNKYIVGISVGWEHSCVASLEVSVPLNDLQSALAGLYVPESLSVELEIWLRPTSPALDETQSSNARYGAG